MRADGRGGPVRVTSGRATELGPAFARDGALLSDVDGWIYRRHRGVVTRLRRGSSVAVSPAGSLAFMKDGAVAVAVGGSERVVATRGSTPAWAPDDRRVV